MISQKGFIKPWMWVVGVVAVLLLIVGGYYNSFATLRQGVDQQFGNVQSSYQRRLDLIPNLVEVAKQAGANEKDILVDVTGLRAGINNASTPGELEKVGNTISSQFAFVAENYPQVRSTDAFLKLQDDLSGTENRINVERNRYNEAVRAYNNVVVRVPGAFFARIFGFTPAEYFQAQQGAENAPQVKDLFN